MGTLLEISIHHDSNPLRMAYLSVHECNNANIEDLPDRAKTQINNQEF